MKTTVIHHSADYDGIFCREIARKFLPDAELIGWDFADKPLIPIFDDDKEYYVMDLPADRVFGLDFSKLTTAQEAAEVCQPLVNKVIWIDHHKSSIESHPPQFRGYRIDGVAACRLAWQWFTNFDNRPCTCDPPHSEGHYDHCLKNVLPVKEEFTARKVTEPLAVRLAGEYDIWDKRDWRAETFQFGLRSTPNDPALFKALFDPSAGDAYTESLVQNGAMLQNYQREQDANLVTNRSYRVNWEGLNWIVLNTGRFNSLTFAALDVPETGHDALMGWRFDGKQFSVSLYHAKHRTDLDLSAIAVKHGGGGHRGACGFVTAVPIKGIMQ